MTDNLPALTDKLNALPQKFGNDAFDKVAATSFLPRIQLMTSNSQACKDGVIPMNNFAIVRGSQNIQSLGATVDVLCLSWRPKALQIAGDEITTLYDPDNQVFKDIVAKAGTPNSGCMYGPEFLLWLPLQKCFVTFFMGSTSARNEAANVRQYIRQPMSLRSQRLKNSKYTWYSPAAGACTTPLGCFPDETEMLAQIAAFENPQVTQTEPVAEGEARER